MNFSNGTVAPKLASRFAYRSLGTVLKSADRPLEESMMRQHVPSIFAVEKHTSRSERYAYIPTIDVVNGLAREGFFPFFAVQSKSRIEGKAEFTKHMLRFRHVSELTRDAKNVNEVIVINSHDGTTTYQMMGGCFEFVCQNGTIVGTVVSDIRVKHSGSVVDNVINGAHQLLSDFSKLDEMKATMRGTILTTGEQTAFARAALAERFEEKESPLTPAQILAPRRYASAADQSLWQTFQNVQENVIRGGIQGRTVGDDGRVNRRQTRGVNGIDQSVKLNRGLSILAEEMLKLKGVA